LSKVGPTVQGDIAKPPPKYFTGGILYRESMFDPKFKKYCIIIMDGGAQYTTISVRLGNPMGITKINFVVSC
jgi:hypothetical protein